MSPLWSVFLFMPVLGLTPSSSGGLISWWGNSLLIAFSGKGNFTKNESYGEVVVLCAPKTFIYHSTTPLCTKHYSPIHLRWTVSSSCLEIGNNIKSTDFSRDCPEGQNTVRLLLSHRWKCEQFRSSSGKNSTNVVWTHWTIVGYHPALGEHCRIKLKYTQMIAIPKWNERK